MNGKNVRKILRWVHIALALFVGAAFYSLLGSDEAYLTATLWGLIPALALTGIGMWKQSLVMKVLKSISNKAYQ
ncbi:hypothetical protein OPW39_13705 [Vibrio europaeus]|uniref:hypothetical protein n=1 Tax=Vibrio europaeus TaxID=300876 RepID=UPI00233ECA9B|nr:hypothetical protein [Vibrio europaeus]MDC5869881.1 hypothetical protein [Vibrio europaeus]